VILRLAVLIQYRAGKNDMKVEIVVRFATFIHDLCGETDCGNLCSKFCHKQTRLYKIIVKIEKNTNGHKFADPRLAAVSPYFKESMVHVYGTSKSNSARLRFLDIVTLISPINRLLLFQACNGL